MANTNLDPRSGGIVLLVAGVSAMAVIALAILLLIT